MSVAFKTIFFFTEKQKIFKKEETGFEDLKPIFCKKLN
jgi:hypothetical protein